MVAPVGRDKTYERKYPIDAEKIPIKIDKAIPFFKRSVNINAEAGGITIKPNTGSAPIARVATEMAQAIDKKRIRLNIRTFKPSVRVVSGSNVMEMNSLNRATWRARITTADPRRAYKDSFSITTAFPKSTSPIS